MVLVAVFFLAYVSMETASPTIIDLWPFVRRRYVHPDVNGGVARLNFSSYGPSDFTSSDQICTFFHGCCKEDCPYNIFHGFYIFSIMVIHTLGSTAMSLRLFGYFFPEIPV
jgi:hypothetical protein